VLKKCQEYTNILEDYVIKIAEDHGRVLSADVMDDIDSRKSRIFTQTTKDS
jgi:hypothetical protein